MFNLFKFLLLTVGSIVATTHTYANTQKTLAKQSLRFVYTSQTPLPPPPKQSEWKQLEEDLSNKSPYILALVKLFRGNKELVIYAPRDLDHDSIPDYRISITDGKFFEGDLDVDGDGVYNTYDLAPYHAGAGGIDHDGNGTPDINFIDKNNNLIPDHIDWDVRSPSNQYIKRMAKIQTELFHKHEILLVNRQAHFNLRSALAALDSIRKVYAQAFYPNHTIPSLKFISAEKQPYLRAESPLSTDAFYSAPTKTLSIYAHTFHYHPLTLLGLYVHEIGHGLQFAMDYSSDGKKENSRTLYEPHKFMKLMHAFGWSATYEEPLVKFLSYLPIFELNEPNFFYQEKSPEIWQQQLDTLRVASTERNVFKDSSLEGLHIVGDYSLTSAWEWLSDNEIAYVYTELIDSVKQDKNWQNDCPTESELSKQIDTIVQKTWPNFYFQNIRNSKIQRWLKARYPIKGLNELVQKYIVQNFCKT